MSSVCCSGIQRIVIPGAKMWGIYKSTDGGTTWTYIHGGSANAADCANADPALVAANATPCSPRGVRQVVLDPSNPDIVYSTSYARGVWRSTDGGATWTQIKPSLNWGDHPRGRDRRRRRCRTARRACMSTKDTPAVPTSRSSAATT